MTLQLDSLYIDEDLGTTGVWVDFYNGSRLKLASIENEKYKGYLARLAKKHRLQLDQNNDDSTGLIQDITAEALAKHVLLDWEGVNLGDQKDASYNPEIGKKALLMAPKLKDFVMEQAGDYTNYNQKVVEEVKKPSSGS